MLILGLRRSFFGINTSVLDFERGKSQDINVNHEVGRSTIGTGKSRLKYAFHSCLVPLCPVVHIAIHNLKILTSIILIIDMEADYHQHDPIFPTHQPGYLSRSL